MLKLDTSTAAVIEIRALRSQSNAAIARHDVTGAIAIMRDDVRVISSHGRLVQGSPAMAQAFGEVFSDAKFVTYVREPESIEVSGATAAEIGRWDGRWQDSVARGRYMARWQHSDIGWRIAAEFYIPLPADGE
jgi:ketosteroid isomerase-like protein